MQCVRLMTFSLPPMFLTMSCARFPYLPIFFPPENNNLFYEGLASSLSPVTILAYMVIVCLMLFPRLVDDPLNMDSQVKLLIL